MLAALPKAPEIYSPVKNIDKAQERQQLVLKRMATLGLISKKEKANALNQEIIVKPKPITYSLY